MGAYDYIKNLPEVMADFEEWVKEATEEVHEAAKEGVQEVAEKILETAKELVPVKSGTLRDSLHIKQAGSFATVRTDAQKAPHGHLVHFGTVHSEGVPFLYQAKERHQGALADAIRKRIKEHAD